MNSKSLVNCLSETINILRNFQILLVFFFGGGGGGGGPREFYNMYNVI